MSNFYVVAGGLAFVCYALCAIEIFRKLHEQEPLTRGFAPVLGLIALLCHVGVSVDIFWMGNGVDLSFYPLAALVLLFVAIIINFEHFYDPARARPVVLVVYPFIAMVILLIVIFHRGALHPTSLGLGLTFHVISSIAAYSMLTYAAFQAILLMRLEKGIRTHAKSRFLQIFVPLESAEQVLFNALWAGLALLTVATMSGFIFLWDRIFDSISHLHVILTLIAWIIYVGLMTAHFMLGWRGTRTTKLSLVAFGLLLVGYFGTKFVLENVLPIVTA